MHATAERLRRHLGKAARGHHHQRSIPRSRRCAGAESASRSAHCHPAELPDSLDSGSSKFLPSTKQLRALDLVTPGARTISDVTGCPGATTCNLGITRSLTLADVLAKELADQSDPEIQKLRIKISGCPNSCGQHHIADIGFYGNARKIGAVQAPFYQMLLGGEVSERGVRFGKQIIPLAAKQVPNVVREVIGFYRNDRHDGRDFPAVGGADSAGGNHRPPETICGNCRARSRNVRGLGRHG